MKETGSSKIVSVLLTGGYKKLSTSICLSTNSILLGCLLVEAFDTPLTLASVQKSSRRAELFTFSISFVEGRRTQEKHFRFASFQQRRNISESVAVMFTHMMNQTLCQDVCNQVRSQTFM